MVAASYYNGGHIFLPCQPHPSTLEAARNGGRIVLQWWLHTAMGAASCNHDCLLLYNSGHILLEWWPHATTMLINPTTIVATFFYNVSLILLHWWPHHTASYCRIPLQWLLHTAMGAPSYYYDGRILLQRWPHSSTIVATSYCNSGCILLQWWPHISTMFAASFYIGGHIIL